MAVRNDGSSRTRRGIGGSTTMADLPRGRLTFLFTAIEAQRALVLHDWPAETPIRVRMGLHTGEPAVRGADYVGVVLNRAARISAAGHGGQILISDDTRTEAEPSLPDASFTNLGKHRLKDLVEPQHIWQVHGEGLVETFPPIVSIDTRP